MIHAKKSGINFTLQRAVLRCTLFRTADGVSFIAATANVGFLIGPVLLGFIAELRTPSFMVLMAFVTVALLLTWRKR